ncbi:uncharacterized protein BDV17DRAFT_136011 [Aspergillus undulatus]|uniref:uncharacterized protein n=1 Tax=Aspergillus undulatus TaxID=1810928 RepID=UPI003CCD5B0A
MPSFYSESPTPFVDASTPQDLYSLPSPSPSSLSYQHNNTNSHTDYSYNLLLGLLSTYILTLLSTTVTLSHHISSRLSWPPFSIKETIHRPSLPTPKPPRLRRTNSMPGPIITREHVLPVRELEADELYVTECFERHVKHCGDCHHFLHPHLYENEEEEKDEEASLCKRGIQYARDVDAYLYCKRGRPYSVVGREHNQPTLVKIPPQKASTRSLLLEIEDGLSLKLKEKKEEILKPLQSVKSRSRSPLISYDRTYPVAPRRAQTYTEIIEREPRNVKSRRVIIYHSPSRSSHRGSPSRGSLYESDAADRVGRSRTSRIYRPAEYYR